MLTMRGAIIACILLLVSASTAAQRSGLASRSRWTFQHYPAVTDFVGRPARPLLDTPLEYSYRTVIRIQASKGPNFAGHYTLAKWGCGSPCVKFVIIDARSGTVYDPGLTFGCANKNGLEASVKFKLSSRLIVATDSSEESGCGTGFYEWDRKQLSLVHFEPWTTSGP